MNVQGVIELLQAAQREGKKEVVKIQGGGEVTRVTVYDAALGGDEVEVTIRTD